MGLRRLLFIVLLLMPASLVFAHAAPVQMDPPSGALVAPGQVTLRLGMSQPVEIAFSKVSLKGPDRTWNADVRLEGSKTVAADLPALVPGRYDVTWRVLSVDGHLTEGSYYITVSASGVPRTAMTVPGPARGNAALLASVFGLGLTLASGLLVARHLRQSLIRG